MSFNFNIPNTNTAPTFGIPSSTTTTTTGVGLQFTGSLNAPTVSTAQTVVTTSSALGGFTIPKTSDAPVVNLNTTTTTTQSSAVPTNQLNFCQLEEFINNWTLELEEQEKIFINQATQVNAWDKILLHNGEKIVHLNEAVEKIKADQEAMEQELEFITAQQSELEECILPLEEDLAKIPQVDVERGQTYLMAETLDSQLKQMSEDLKEVIEHLNEASNISDTNNPIVQIGRILNAHMDSLKWVETSTSAITTRVDEIEKMHDSLRKDNERSFRLAYYNN